MVWITTYILLGIVAFYALLAALLVTRMLHRWVRGEKPVKRFADPALPEWLPPDAPERESRARAA